VEKEVNLKITENEALALVFVLSNTEDSLFKGCSPAVSYHHLQDKIAEQTILTDTGEVRPMKLFFVMQSNGKEHEDYNTDELLAVGENAKEVKARFTTDYWIEVIVTEVKEVDGYIISIHT
jgi:hypothetical protein